MTCTPIEEHAARRPDDFFEALRRAWRSISRRVWREPARRRRERVAARQLARLDDHLLRDLGIDRADIEAVVRQGR